MKITAKPRAKKSLLNEKLAMKERKMSKPANPVIVMDGDDDDDLDNNSEEMVGGKFNFVRSISKFGKDMGKTINNEVIKQGSKEIVKNGMQFAKDGVKNFMKEAPEMMEEAPMLAAGMKKKRTRTVGPKEKSRQQLIKKIMVKYSVTLPEASKLIKENNMSY